MPGLYGFSSNANISVYNTTGLYNVGNANIIVGNVGAGNTTGLYTAQGNVFVPTNAQALLNLLFSNGNVNFALTPNGLKVQANAIVSVGSTYSNANVAVYLASNTDPTIQSIFIGQQTLSANLGAFETYANLTFGTSNYANANVVALMTQFPGNIVSNANATYSLGSSTTWWKDLYLSNNALYLGGIPLSIINGNLAVNSVQIPGTYSNANVSAYLPTDPTITTIQANIGAYQTFANANAATQATAINTINANLGAFETYANATFGTSSYGNANVAVFLPTYTGNIGASNVNATGKVTLSTMNYTSSGVIIGKAAIGSAAGAVSIGDSAGGTGDYAIAIGQSSGKGAGTTTIAIGTNTAGGVQGNYSIAIGQYAGDTNIGANAIVMGSYAGRYATIGTNSIVLGTDAQQYGVASNSIILNATGQQFNGNVSNAFFVNPVRNDTGNVSIGLYYNATTKEITYATATAGTTYSNANVAAYLPTDPTITAIQANIGGSQTYANVTFATKTALQVLDANVGAFETYANLTFGPSSPQAYGNANVAAYLPTDPTITGIQANIGGSQIYANATFATQTALQTLNANVGAYEIATDANLGTATTNITTLFANAATQAIGINNLNANLGAFETYANATFGTSNYSNVNVAAYIPTDPTITGIQANIGGSQTYANATFATKTALQVLDANVGAYQIATNANLGTATTNITTLFSNAATQATEINTINANLGAFETYANATFTVSTYSNANVAAYLPTYSGQIGGTIVVPNFSTANAQITGGNTSVYNSTATNKFVGPHFDAANSAGGQLRNAGGTPQLEWGGGGGNNISVDVAININPANAQVSISPTGTGSVNIKPTGHLDINTPGVGFMNNVVIGNATPTSAIFTTIQSSGNITANAGAFFIGNGSQLTGIVSSYGNTQVAAYLATNTDPTISNLNANAAVQAISINNINANLGAFQTYANATFSTGGAGTYSNANVAAFLPVYGGNISANNITVTGNLYSNTGDPIVFGQVNAFANTVVLNGTVSLSANADILSFTLPSAGVWKITYVVRAQAKTIASGSSSFSNGVYCLLADNSNNIVANSAINLLAATDQSSGSPPTFNATVQVTGTGISFITTSGSATYKLQGFSYGSQIADVISDTAGYTSVTIEQTNPEFAISNVAYTGNISYAGNITSNGSIFTADGIYWLGNGAVYSGNYGNLQVGQYLTSGATAITANLGNVITTNGVFWANGTAYSSGGGGTYGNTQVAAFLNTTAATPNVFNPFLLAGM